MSGQTVLVVDDEDFVRESLVDLLASEGIEALAAQSAASAISCLDDRQVDAVVTDLKMPGTDGLRLLEAVRQRHRDLPVVLLTGVGTIAEAVEAMKLGAFDFVEKPVEPEKFLLLLRRAFQHRRLLAEVAHLRHEVEGLRGGEEIIGISPAIAAARALIAQVAPTSATVLITGESGSGKELVAARIHRLSQRSNAIFVRVNCAAITESLFESEFFGHRRGAFTSAISDRQGRFAEAEGGSIFLDEIGTLKGEMQAKLLRVLETGEYQVVGESRTRRADVRIIAATNEDLTARVRQGTFRPDLFYRLNVFPIAVPPLRERKEDIPVLASHFFELYERAFSSPAPAPSGRRPASVLCPEALAVLESYDWPGNIRELRNVVERAVILSNRETPSAAVFSRILALGGGSAALGGPGASGEDGDLNLRRRVEALERRLLLDALARANGRKTEAAQLLGIDPKNLAYYLRKHPGIEANRPGGRERA